MSVILIAQQYTPDGGAYHWTQNTVSQLASQGYENKALMQAGFIGFGLLFSLASISHMKKTWRSLLQEIPITSYAVCILFSGVFCTAPFVPDTTYDAWEASIHSFCATAAGVAFSVGLVAHMFLDDIMKRKWAHLSTLLLVMGSSLAFGMAESNQGLLQRMLYGVSFLWMIFVYHAPARSTPHGSEAHREAP